ncbi:DUF1642 domain-containing protein [Jeotgalibaca porci]|uniref:DUF1642 domain-containing protein n=1 Tax=Jeotgalibaca porci TaxID=1868793 RepID=UPI0035A045DA
MDKQELLESIENMGSEVSENYPHDQVVDRELVIKLVEGLDEPEKVKSLVVPKELGEWLACQKLGNEGSFFSIIIELEDMWLGSGFEEFITDNKKQLIEVILGNRGYEVEKEKLYHVVSPDNLTMLYKINGVEVKSSHGYLLSQVTQFGSEHKSFYQLTEKEIKDYDERYLPFMVPINEVNND